MEIAVGSTTQRLRVVEARYKEKNACKGRSVSEDKSQVVVRNGCMAVIIERRPAVESITTGQATYVDKLLLSPTQVLIMRSSAELER